MNLFLFLVPFLAFIPGIFIARSLSKRMGLTASGVETTLVGSIIWLYIIIVPSLILGLFTSYILLYFYIVTAVGLAILACTLFTLIFKIGRFKAVFHEIRGFIFKNYLFLICFSSLLVLISILTIYHPLFLEFDSTSTYLSNAKSILETASLQINQNQLSPIMDLKSPAVSILYSWTILISNISVLRILPIIYFVLTGLVVFSLSKKLAGGYAPFIAVIVYASMYPVLNVFARFSLYPDIALTFYVSVAALFLSKGIDMTNPFGICSRGLQQF